MRTLRGVPGKDFGIEEARGEFPQEIEVRPLEAPPDTTIRVPGSKSVTNRALLIAALSDGVSTLENPLFSDDSFWMMNALARLGFDVEVFSDEDKVRISGQRGIIPRRNIEVFVGNAGTVARFLPPALSLGEGPYVVDGSPRMRERPVSDLVEAMRGLGAGVEYGGEEGRFPLIVSGGGIRGGRVRVEGSKSSQFMSGAMISAVYAREPVTLEVSGGVRQSYVGITRDVMRSFGVEVEKVEGEKDDGGTAYSVRPGVYRAREFRIEPDASGASYFFAAAALTGGRARVPGLGSGSTQGDLRFVEVLRGMGCEVEVGESGVEVRGPEKLRGVEVDMNDFSDTFITLAAIAPFAEGPTVIKNIEHTRHQETDRISAVATELSRLGVEVEEKRDGMRILPGRTLRPEGSLVETYDDHRIAMAFALIGLRVPGIRIKDPACVSKTMPDYFERLDLLRQSPRQGV